MAINERNPARVFYQFAIAIFCLLIYCGRLSGQSGLNNISCDTWLKTTGTPDAVEIGDLDITGNKITVEALINRTVPYTPSNDYRYSGDIVSKHMDPGDCNYLLRVGHAEITTTNGFFATPAICNFTINKTYHVAFVYDGTTLKFYRNGFLMSEVAATGNLITNDWLTKIGDVAGPWTPPSTNFIGYINEVRIWNVARTQAEIRANMAIALPNPTTQVGLQAYYNFSSLTNRQGNASWNGILKGVASINQTNSSCSYVADSCDGQTVRAIQPEFSIPDSVCVNTPIDIVNNTLGESSSYWNFCTTDAEQIPEAVNLGNVGGAFRLPVFTDQVYYKGNYYVFVCNNYPGGLVRLDFGNSMLNTPTAVSIGNIGGVIPNNLEGIQMVNADGKWYAILVAGYPAGGTASRIIKVDFGADPTNLSPAATNWGNIGNLNYPIDLYVFKEAGTWYGFTINSINSTLTRFNFGSNFNNPPTAINLGNIGGLNFPTGIFAFKDSINWHVFLTNNSDNSSITRLDFGTSLLNAPTAANLGNVNNTLRRPRDITLMRFCDKLVGYVINGLSPYDDVVRLDFGNDITATPTAKSLGKLGNPYFPHSISKFFRVGDDLYTFVPNVDNNTITRLKIKVCSTPGIPGSGLRNPPSFSYSTPGTYNVSLTIDDGLPTQAVMCKQVVVTSCLLPLKIKNFRVNQSDSYNTVYFETFEEPTGVHVELERAGDDLKFLLKSGILLDGNGSYSILDNSVGAESKYYYYRLKMIDQSGSITYSEIVKVKNENLTPRFKIWRGQGNQLVISAPRSEEIFISYFDMSGRLLLKRKIFVSVGQNRLSTQSLPKAIYFISLQSKNESTGTFLRLD